jgi:hypothetical protein
VYVWDDSSEAAHEVPYSHNYWHLPMPEDLRHMEMASGLKYDVLEPLRKYHVQYKDGDDLEFDLVYEGLFAPFVAPSDDEITHIDQPCHVTGTLKLDGEEIAVDCYEMRDKSWSVRPDFRNLFPGGMRVSYAYGFSADQGFQATTFSFDSDEGVARSGFLWREGSLAPLTTATRRVERDRGRPDKLVVEGTDTLGRSFTAHGQCVNRLAFQSTPGIFAWISGTEWQLDGAPVWGEDQEMAPPRTRIKELREARGR